MAARRNSLRGAEWLQKTETNIKCHYAVPDNLGYINCTRGNGHVGLCQTPCPYERATASASKGERCHPEKVGESGFFQAVFGETSRFQAVQLRCHLLSLVAVEAVS